MPETEPLFPQTPLFRAQQSDRYMRQEAIRRIEKLTGRSLLVYESSPWKRGAEINVGDIQPFGDLLQRIPSGAKVDLMLNSLGGDIDAAEKVIYMCRKVASEFRVVVPEHAKSAATLIALASDRVLMGFASELGPIDAQLAGPGPGGAVFQTSARSFLDKFDEIKKEVERTGQLSPAYYPLLEGLNLGFIRMCETLMERSEKFARKWLSKHMLKGDAAKAAKIAKKLCDVKKWLTHGMVIDADEAERLGIKVERIERDNPLWQEVWYLHCCYGVVFRSTNIAKVFESPIVSLAFE